MTKFLILKNRQSDSERCKFVGGYVPPLTSEYLTLYTIRNQTTKSVLFRRILEEFEHEHSSRTTLIVEIAKELENEWREKKANRDKHTNVNVLFTLFINTLKTELKAKKVPEETIDNIINLITI